MPTWAWMPASLHDRAAATPIWLLLWPSARPASSCLFVSPRALSCLTSSKRSHRARKRVFLPGLTGLRQSCIPLSPPSIQFCPSPSVRCHSRSSLPPLSRSLSCLLPPSISSLALPSAPFRSILLYYTITSALCHRPCPSSLFAFVFAPHPACTSTSHLKCGQWQLKFKRISVWKLRSRLQVN